MRVFENNDFQAFICDATPSTMDLANSISQRNLEEESQIFSVSTRYQYKGRGRQESEWIQKDRDEHQDKRESL